MIKEDFIVLDNGESMHYLFSGKPEDELLLFIHGYPMSASLYRNVISRFIKDKSHRFYCVAPSLIGFGKSSCPSDKDLLSPLFQVNCLQEFIAKLGNKSFSIVVHDWGGPIGTLASLRRHENLRNLIVLNTSLSVPSVPLIGKVMSLVLYLSNNKADWVFKYYPQGIKRAIQLLTTEKVTDDVLENYVAPYALKDGLSRMRAGINLFGKAHQERKLFDEIRERAKNFRGKVLMIWSENDPLLGYRSPLGKSAAKYIQSLFSDVSYKELQGANHFLQEDKPEEIAIIISDFLTNLD